jgi:CubicO group peptidase (beta-lactamase class C family)
MAMATSRLKVFFPLLLILVILSSCAKANPETVEYWPTAGWQVSTPEEQGMDSELLAEMLGIIDDENYQIDSVTVVRNGYIVADAITHPPKTDSKHIIYSCTKSVVSILIGIAINQGHIEGVEQPVQDFFPDREIENIDANKEAMTLEHLLTMSTGLECRDSYLYRWQGMHEMMSSPDWAGYVLDLPMVDAPGNQFEYCNGASHLLSAIISETTGLNALEYAEENLFGPLGITDVDWPADPQGVTVGFSELRMHPQDMAKIGYLYLNEGEWDGEQVVSSEWVAASSQEHISATLADGYGYQWWVEDSGIYLALGYRGQFIYVMPGMDLVVVFTSTLPDYDFYVPRALLDDYVIPAVLSDGALPANPDGTALLEYRIEALAEP